MIERIATFLTAVTIAAYWFRVLQMARRQRRKTGRAANFIPAERLGKILRLIWNPVVVLWIVLPLAASFWINPPKFFAPLFDHQYLALPGAMLAFACFLLTLICWQKMGSSWRMGIDPGEKTQLVVTGPYAYLRHPIYGLSMVMMIGSVLSLPSPAMLLIGSIHIALLAWEARREEQHLQRTHGSVYEHYLQRVGGFFPKSIEPYEGAQSQDSPAIRLEDSIPLNIFQRIMRWWDQRHPYNAMHAILLDRAIDKTELDAAWLKTLKRSQLGPVVSHGWRYAFLPVTAEMASAEVIDSNLSVQQLAARELNRRFESGKLPFRLFLQPQAEGSRIIVTYQHWVADGRAIRLLIERLLTHLSIITPEEDPLLTLPHGGYWHYFSPMKAGWDLIEGILSMLRAFHGFRSARKVSSKGLNSPEVDAVTCDSPAFPIGALYRYALRHSVKINDLMLAALAESASRHVPMQDRRKRVNWAIGNVVDLSGSSRHDLTNTFGLFLGLSHVVLTPKDISQFDRSLESVARQSRLMRLKRLAPSSVLRLTVAHIAGFLSSVEEMYHFYRKEMPLIAGVSNVNLNGTVLVESDRQRAIKQYFRLAPTGPTVPLTLSVTTLRETVEFAVTYRSALMSREAAEEILRGVETRLRGLVSSDSTNRLIARQLTGAAN